MRSRHSTVTCSDPRRIIQCRAVPSRFKLQFWVSRLVLSIVLLSWSHLSVATWSIIAFDEATLETVVASATCLENIDLQALSPVVVPGVGAGVVQALLNDLNWRRQVLYSGLTSEYGTGEVSRVLQQHPVAHRHQHGIVSVGRQSVVERPEAARRVTHTVTFTGAGNSAFAGGLSGRVRSAHYAMFGNLLVDNTVLAIARNRFTHTDGPLSARVLAAMQAAKEAGGDSRCSVHNKSAHVGYFIVTRQHDAAGLCTTQGCAQGDYFININIRDQSATDSDPVAQMVDRYAHLLRDLSGHPDAIASEVLIEPLANQHYRLRINARDLTGQPAVHATGAVVKSRDNDSMHMTSTSGVKQRGDGVFDVVVESQNPVFSETAQNHIVIVLKSARGDVQLTPSKRYVMSTPNAVRIEEIQE